MKYGTPRFRTWLITAYHALRIDRFPARIRHPWAHPRYPSFFKPRTAWIAGLALIILYAACIGVGTVYIYRKQTVNPLTRFSEQIFPYPAGFVDGQIIYLSRFRREVNALLTYASNHNLHATRKETEQHVMTQLVNRILYSEKLQTEGITITAADVQKALDQIYQEKGGQAQLSQFLLDNYGPDMTLSDFQLLTQDSLVESVIEHQLLVHAEVSHILIAVPSNPNDQQVADAKKKADDVRARITSPDQFASVAQDASDDIASRDKGGDLGTTVRSTDLEQRFSPAFEQAVFTLPVGTVSEPIRSQYGWEIIMVRSRGGK
ncbi:peptidylprolyl isomerase, partial [Patescibacteria group bacterium]|nr:peptidylprolyl isomerase [Patescibacteria group bacterium]